MSLKSRTRKRLIRGAGIAEYLLILVGVAFGAVTAITHLGQVAQQQTATMAQELAGVQTDLGGGNGSPGSDAPNPEPGGNGSGGTGGGGGDTGSGGGGNADPGSGSSGSGGGSGGSGDTGGDGTGGDSSGGGDGGTMPSHECTAAWRADDDFLARSEGKLIKNGYVPQYSKDVVEDGEVIHEKGDVMGRSGVTISTGIDLGQQSKSGTRAVIDAYINKEGNEDNVSVDALMKKLSPYFGLQKQDAVDALAKTPLSVTLDEAQLLAHAFGFNTQKKAAQQFNDNNKKEMDFKMLPEEAQTVIVDFVYQYWLSEDGGVRSTFWKYVYNGEWKKLADWLKSEPDPYDNRRRREGDRLQEGIEGGSLPESGNPCEA